MASAIKKNSSPVLHVVLVGFHHKKGSQVEFSYPPLIDGNEVDSNEVPEEWKHLPSLAIPDGAHNYTQDTIFFHLPSREDNFSTVYGVACYRQIDASDLLNKTSDVTRSSVQKSVCVLSRLPLFGLVNAKLALITHAYFKEKDFSKVGLLQQTYENLTHSVQESLTEGTQVFMGMSVRDLVADYRLKILVLFKLILLERRVLFYGAPVEKLCNIILSLLSLFPGLIENGLEEAVTTNSNKLISPTMKSRCVGEDSEEFLEIRYHGESSSSYQSSPQSFASSPTSDVDTKSGYLVTNEPQSPTIPRDLSCENLCKMLNRPENKAEEDFSILKENTNSLSQISQSLDNTSDQNLPSNANGIPGIKSGGRRSSETRPENTPTTTALNDSKESSPNIILMDNPLAHMSAITQIEAVQSGQTLQNSDSVLDMEEYSELLDKMEEVGKKQQEGKKRDTGSSVLRVNLEDSGNAENLGHELTSSIEELDSPESILKIDKEDCFSWEEDRLCLAFNDDSDKKCEDPDSLEHFGEKNSPNKLKKQKKKSEDGNKLQSFDESDFKEIDLSGERSKTPHQKNKKSADVDAKRSPGGKAVALKNKLSSALENVKEKTRFKRGSSSDSANIEINMMPIEKPSTTPISRLKQDDFGFPLALFTKGSICHPYLSLQYFDILQDVNVRAFVIGATNMLFTHKRHLTDVVIQIEECHIDFHDKELQKILALTTADLRFADIIVKATIEDVEENDLYNGTEWEGGDEWLRAQFKLYLQHLLVTCSQDDPKLLDDFGSHFVQAFKTTHNYRVWAALEHPASKDVSFGHPCHGNLGMSDLKMKLSHSIQNTERGKKINAAVVQTGKYVVQTGKAVGGALSNAQSAVSSWFSSLRQEFKKEEKEANS